MFDASVIVNVLYIYDGFHTAPFAIIASHTVPRRISDRSVALAASSSSAYDVWHALMCVASGGHTHPLIGNALNATYGGVTHITHGGVALLTWQLRHLPLQTFCTFFDGFFTPPFAIMASHTVSLKGL